MNKYGYVLAAVSANLVANPALAEENNQNYINLASNVDTVLSVKNVEVSHSPEVLKTLVDKNPIDYSDPINKNCVSKGFDVVDACPASGNCVPSYCPENNLFMRCSCFCSLNACNEEGFIEQECGKYQTEEDCPMLPNKGYVKCVDMADFQKCIVDDYLETDSICSGYTKAEYCSYDKTYLKCVKMNDAEKCKSDGYNITVCKDGEMTSNKCPFGDEELYLSCEKFVCDSNYVKECNDGYIKDRLDSCRDDDGVKYKCLEK